MLDGLINILLVLFILVVLVVVHEFGHFVIARRAGVRVHEFGIGFPPRARVLGRDRETVYTLNWLPIGGFVRLEGEEGESDDPRSFVRQPLRTRLVILLAGVVMNFALAFLIFSLIAGLGDPTMSLRFGEVQPGSPAVAAGLTPSRILSDRTLDESGDEILAIDGQRFALFDDFPDRSAPLLYLRSRAGEEVALLVRHADGSEEEKRVHLRVPGPDEGPLGIAAVVVDTGDDIRQDPLSAVAAGARRTVDASTIILRGLAELISNIGDPQVSGPIGIVSAVGTVRSELPPVFMFWFIALLSANLAVVNVLPFPPMDGGRIAVSLVQAVSGNRITVAAERLVYLTGFLLLMALLVWISYFDIRRLGGGT